MKKVIFAALLLLAVGAYAHSYIAPSYVIARADGRHISASRVPAAVMATFNAMFPGATNVQWEVQREHGSIEFKAQFKFNGVQMTARFAPDGTYLGA